MGSGPAGDVVTRGNQLATFPALSGQISVYVNDDGTVMVELTNLAQGIVSSVSPEVSRCLAAVLTQAANVASGVRRGHRPKAEG
jgi:hypothetical protein